MELNLQHRTALITGSNRGTGEVIAQTLAREGANVVLHSPGPGEKKGEKKAEKSSVWGDISTPEGCAQVLAQLQQRQLHIDILVNNYGTTDRHSWGDTDTDKWLQMYQVNVLSAARMAQGLMAGMRARGWGRILNLGTIGSHQPNSFMPAYYAAKGALATLGVSLTSELSGSGITVNTVSPGYVRTAEVEAGYRARARKKGWGEDWASIEKKIVETDFPNPCGRIAERQEIADLVAYLCSPLADFINGQNIRIDGGAICYV